MTFAANSAESNAELVRNAVETVFNQHRVDAIEQFFAESFVQHSPYVPHGGRRELAQWWRRTVEAIPDIAGPIEHLVASGDRVAVFRTLKGTIRKDMPELG